MSFRASGLLWRIQPSSLDFSSVLAPGRPNTPPKRALSLLQGGWLSSTRHLSLGTRSKWVSRNKAALCRKRTAFSLSSIPAPIQIPLIFSSLLLTLWAYKCLMMILFQNKIIYMPSIPPFTRSEKIEAYAAICKPVMWREERITSGDGVEVALAIGAIEGQIETEKDEEKEVVVLYFQGNGGSLPPRMPDLSKVLKALQGNAAKFTMVALSYRGYWTSRGRASERGIKLDAAAAVLWIAEKYPHASLVLWGQSIGAGVATTAATVYQKRTVEKGMLVPHIAALILETPFTSVRDMLTAIYPQKWLPYRYLYPFLWSQWDSRTALKQISQSDSKPQVLIVAGERDEVVPQNHAGELEAICTAGALPVNRVVVRDALHHEALIKAQGRKVIVNFLNSLIRKG